MNRSVLLLHFLSLHSRLLQFLLVCGSFCLQFPFKQMKSMLNWTDQLTDLATKLIHVLQQVFDILHCQVPTYPFCSMWLKFTIQYNNIQNSSFYFYQWLHQQWTPVSQFQWQWQCHACPCHNTVSTMLIVCQGQIMNHTFPSSYFSSLIMLLQYNLSYICPKNFAPELERLFRCFLGQSLIWPSCSTVSPVICALLYTLQ